MDPLKLQALRARYAEGGAFDATDPTLRTAIRQVQRPDGRRTLPYSGVPTFLGLPIASDIQDLDVAVIGVPMDLGVSNRPGRAIWSLARCAPSNA